MFPEVSQSRDFRVSNLWRLRIISSTVTSPASVQEQRVAGQRLSHEEAFDLFIVFG